MNNLTNITRRINLAITIMSLITLPFIISINGHDDYSEKESDVIIEYLEIKVPSIAADMNGNVFISHSYMMNDVARTYKIFFDRSLDGGNTFNKGGMIQSSYYDDTYNGKLYVDNNGIIHCFYEIQNLLEDRRLGYARSNDHGGSFIGKRDVNTDNAFFPGHEFVVFDNNIYLLTRMGGGQSYSYYLHVSRDLGKTFEDPVEMGISHGYHIDVDIYGNVYILNNTYENSWLTISYDNCTTFTEPLLVCSDPYLSRRAFFSVDGNKKVHAIWPHGTEDKTYYASKGPEDDAFSEPVIMFNDLLNDTRIETDHWGGIYVVCSIPDTQGNNEIYLIYSNDGANFEDPVQLNDNTMDDQRNPAISYDGRNGIHIIWRRPGEVYDGGLYYTNLLIGDHPPDQIRKIPEVHIDEDSIDFTPTLDLNYYVFDDMGEEGMHFNVEDTSNAGTMKVYVDNGFLEFEQIIEHWYGKAEFSISCHDEGKDGIEGNSDDNYIDLGEFTLIVEPTDDPPEIDTIGDFNITGEFSSIDVFEDMRYNLPINTIEYDDEECELILYSASPFITLDRLNQSLRIDPLKDFIGTMNISLMITDINGSSILYNITFNILNVNDPPMPYDDSLTISMNEDTVNEAWNIGSMFYDIDSDKLEFSCIGSENIKVVQGEDLGLRIIPDQDFYGSENITLISSDGENTTSCHVLVIVYPVNDAPVNNDFTYDIDENNTCKVTLRANPGYDIDSINFTYTWLIDDSFTLVGQVIEHTFIESFSERKYNVIMTVSDGDLISLPINHTVTIPPHRIENNLPDDQNNTDGNITDNNGKDISNGEEDEKDLGQMIILLLISLIILMIISFILIFMIIRIKKNVPVNVHKDKEIDGIIKGEPDDDLILNSLHQSPINPEQEQTGSFDQVENEMVEQFGQNLDNTFMNGLNTQEFESPSEVEPSNEKEVIEQPKPDDETYLPSPDDEIKEVQDLSLDEIFSP